MASFGLVLNIRIGFFVKRLVCVDIADRHGDLRREPCDVGHGGCLADVQDFTVIESESDGKGSTEGCGGSPPLSAGDWDI